MITVKKFDYNMHNFDQYYRSQRRGAYYTRELMSLPIFLIVKWDQSSPWRSSNSTYAVVVVIDGWACAEMKLQLPQRPLDVLGSFFPVK